MPNWSDVITPGPFDFDLLDADGIANDSLGFFNSLYSPEELLKRDLLDKHQFAFDTAKNSYNQAKENFSNSKWYQFGKRRKFKNEMLSNLNDMNFSRQAAAEILPGIENLIPDLTELSAELMQSDMQSAVDAKSDMYKEKISNTLNNGWTQAGLAVMDIAGNKFDLRNTYGGKEGELAKGLDSTYDSASSALMSSGNPYAMGLGAVMKGMGFLNKVIPGSTDGMTKTDAFLDSSFGALSTLGLSKINAWTGSTTDKFEVDLDVKANMGIAYTNTYDNLDDAASVAGKKYGGLSSGARKRAQVDINRAKSRLSALNQINEDAMDRNAAALYEGIGLGNQMSLTGGYQSLRAAKQGMKVKDLRFALKVCRAARGLRFNNFEFANPNGLNLKKPEEVGYPDSKKSDKHKMDKAQYDQLLETLRNSGLYIENNITTTGTETNVNTNSSSGIQSRLRRQLSTSSQPSIQVPNPEMPVVNPLADIVLPAATTYVNTGVEPVLPDSINEDWMLGELQKHNITLADDGAYDVGDRYDVFTALAESIQRLAAYGRTSMPITLKYKKSDSDKGTVTINPTTRWFKEGGTFNVIPEGALHKNKHNMDDAEGLTKKGIPVVTEENGKKIQLAEIEVNEIIFRLEVTEELEKLAKEGTEEAAIKAGKLLTKEILHNTHDNTGLLEEV